MNAGKPQDHLQWAEAAAWLARTRYPGLTDGLGTAKGEVAGMLEAIRALLGAVRRLDPR